jgi:hypothetical protein
MIFDTVVLDKYHWMLYFLVTAMYPCFLITLNDELLSVPVTVRVGQVSIIRIKITDYLYFIGRRCCWPSRQTTYYLWVPNTSNARTARHNRTGRSGRRPRSTWRLRRHPT